MKRIILLAFAASLFFVYLPAQQWQISGLENSGEVKLIRDRSFDGNSLWGYMNGGADLYLEYGFRALRVQELMIDSQEVKVEMFLMEDPYAARALYSVLAEGISDSTWRRPWHFNPYQAQIVFNDFYINIINYTGSERGLKACIDVSELVGLRFSHIKLESPPPLSGSKGMWKAFFGPLGCRMIAPELEEITEGLTFSVVWVQKLDNIRQNTALISLLEAKKSLHSSIQRKAAERFTIREDVGGTLRVEWQSAISKEAGEGPW